MDSGVSGQYLIEFERKATEQVSCESRQTLSGERWKEKKGKWAVPKEDTGLGLGKHQLALTSEFVTLKDPLQEFCHLTSSVKSDGVWIPKGNDIGQRSWEEPQKRVSLTASLFAHGEMSSITPSCGITRQMVSDQVPFTHCHITSEKVISPNADDLLHLHTPHRSVVQKIAASCLSAAHTNPRLCVFWRRHRPPCVGRGLYRNSLSFLWHYWKWQKGWFFS